jgi:hypothetical protein
MPRFADDEDSLTEDEWPDEADTDDDADETELVRCVSCGEMIAEDSPQYPHCKNWGDADRVREHGSGAKRLGWTIVVCILVGLILVMWHGLGR